MKLNKILQGVLITSALFSGTTTVHAGPDPFIGEVQWFAGNFAPRGWAFCDGQLLSISSHSALFSILGTTYGGDGRTTFGLPDVRGRVIVHQGTGPGLTNRRLGARGGSETETLATNQMPSHTHTLRASGGSATAIVPNGNVLASPGRTRMYDSGVANADMHASAINPAGGSQSHNNMQPYNTLSCIISLQGTFPSRN
jgi:microcystin-dependent protein